MKAKNVICRGRVQAIAEAAAAWKLDHDDAMKARDIEDLVHEYLWVTDFLEEWNKQAWELLFANKLANVHETGESLMNSLASVVDVFPRVKDGLRWAEDKHYTVDKAEELERATNRLQKMLADVQRRWPFISLEQVEASRASLTRGDSYTAEDFLRDLQNHPVERSKG